MGAWFRGLAAGLVGDACSDAHWIRDFRHQMWCGFRLNPRASRKGLSRGRGPLRQESCPLGLTHPPGGQTDDHETDL